MKKLISLSLLFFLCLTAYSQQEIIDLEGYFKGKYNPESYYSLSWRPETHQFAYLKSASMDTLFLEDTHQKRQTLLTLNHFKKIIGNQEIRYIPFFEWITKDKLYFPSLKTEIDISTEEITTTHFPMDEWNVIDANIEHRLFIVKNEDDNVYVMSAENSYKPVLLSPDTGKNIVFGESVHRSEWGIDEGQYISKSGGFIAFYRMDESMVEDYPLVNTSTSIATVEMMKYPMAGRESHEVMVGIFDVNKSMNQNRAIYHYIENDPVDGEFLTNLTFSPDEKFLYITHLNRSQDRAKLIEYDLMTGKKVRVILEEQDERYVEPNTRMHFLKNGSFIWQSDRDGWKHCYLYDHSGKLIKQLTSGQWEVIELMGTDSKEEKLYIMTNREDPTGRYLYEINMKNGKTRNLTLEKGTHSVLFSTDYCYFIDRFTNLKTPQNTVLHDVKKSEKQILQASSDPYRNSLMGDVSIFSIKNKRGDDLYCRMILPPEFDSTRRYPCFVYVYGGPHSQLVTDRFMSGGTFLYYMAQKGYVIFTLDNRGTAYRGAEFEKTIHRQLGSLEAEDQICGIEYLHSLPFIDNNRIGLDGWSYGGFMILTLITEYPDLFCSASIGGPVVDWKWYEVMYGERYMDTPEENPEGYAESSILPKVKNIKCELLVMHGAQDHTVVWQNSLELLRQSVIDGVQMEYFVYPDHDHNVRGKERVHLWRKIEKFHDQHLKKMLIRSESLKIKSKH